MKRILLVEDEESTRVLLKGILQRAGFTQVAALEDPRKTVERYLSYQPDLILIDYHMPMMTGLEAIELLRPHLPEYFPILMLTADERPELRQTALASGAKDFLTKPVNAVEVTRMPVGESFFTSGPDAHSRSTAISPLIHTSTRIPGMPPDSSTARCTWSTLRTPA